MTRVNSTGKETASNFSPDNGTGLAVRTALKDILESLRTVNAAAGDPSGSANLAAYQTHIDSDTNLLKIRNGANSAFVTLGNVSQTNFGHVSLSENNTLTGTNTFDDDVTFTSANTKNILFDKSDNSLKIGDSVLLKIGDSADLIIQHNASKSIINEAGTGDLEIQRGGTAVLSVVSGGLSLTGGAASNITALSDGSTITIDMATACHHSVTLGGNRTFAAPNNQVVGQSGSIFITQDGTGSRTASFNSAFKFLSGVAPTLSTAANATDRIDYIIKSSNVIHCSVSLDVK